MDCHSQKPKATHGVDGHQWYWGEVGVLSLGVFILLIKEFRYNLRGTLRDGFVIMYYYGLREKQQDVCYGQRFSQPVFE